MEVSIMAYSAIATILSVVIGSASAVAIIGAMTAGDHGTKEQPTGLPAPTSAFIAAQPIAAVEPDRLMPKDFFNWEKQNTLADRHGWFIAELPTYTDTDRKRWIAENPEQYKAYSERRRQGEYANLILFDFYCPDLRFINSIRSKIFAEWNVLPVEQRTHVLDHELHMIHKQYDGFRDPESGEWIKGGGMKRFCEYTDEDIRKGYWDHVILNGTHTK
jgi:hypothetical protein